MNYAEIKKCDVANGPGVRVSLFVSGCTHHCKECFNKETWDFQFGKPFTQDTINEILELLNPDYIKGITLLGGEPMEQVNQQGLLPLLRQIREKLPDKTVWCLPDMIMKRMFWPEWYRNGRKQKNFFLIWMCWWMESLRSNRRIWD